MHINQFLRLMYTAAEANPDGCWEWRHGGAKGDGYGIVYIAGRQQRVNRLVVGLFHRPLASGEYACHHCDNPRCFRPDHLFPGTPLENRLDCVRKGRQAHANRTTCQRGHEFTPENTVRRQRSDGQWQRWCRQCKNIDEKARLARIRRERGCAISHAGASHCRRGHEYTEANTIIRVYKGKSCRICRTCRDNFNHEYHKRRRAGRS